MKRVLSIIIITKNEEKMLPKLLESIENQDYKDYEIIVSDAKSTDNTRKIARKYKCIITEGGLPSRGRNNGAKKASGNVLLFLDADVILPKDFLSKNLKEFYKKNLVAGTTIYIPISDNIIDKVLYNIFNNFSRVMQYVSPHATGICIFCKKDIFNKIGGFDENIRFAEDHAFAYKTKEYGKFRILNSVPLFCDIRRFEKEGRFKVVVKYLFADIYRLFIGEMKNPPFNYEMQGVNAKLDKK